MKFVRPSSTRPYPTGTGWTSVPSVMSALASAVSSVTATLADAASALTLSVTASGWGSEVSLGGTLTGPAPFGVFFDATGTSHTSGTVDTWLEACYFFDFGYDDPADAGDWLYGADAPYLTKAHYVGGAICGHIYQTPGTYTVWVRALLPSGTTALGSLTVVVEDPNTVYAGAATVLCSNDGSSDATNYPGATVHNVATSGYPAFASNTRYLYKRGDTYTSLLTLPTNDSAGSSITGVQIGAWGTGALPNFTALDFGIMLSTAPVASTSNLSPKFPSKITVSDIKGGVTVGAFISYLVIQRCDMSDRPYPLAIPDYGQNGANGFESASEGPVVFEYQSTSTTSLTVGTGSKTLVVGTAENSYGGDYTVGQQVNIANGSHFMRGLITAWDSGTRTMTVDATTASSTVTTLSSWTVTQYPQLAIMDRMQGTSSAVGQVWPNPRDLHWCENRLSILPQPDTNDRGTFFVYGRNVNHCGNWIGPSGGHQTRIKGAHCLFMAHNYYDGDTTYTAGHVVAVRSEKRNLAVGQENLSPPAATRQIKVLGQSGRMNTRYVLIDRNQFGQTDYTSTCASPYLGINQFNHSVALYTSDVLFQNNRLYRGTALASGVREILWDYGVRIASRNNTTYLSTPSTRGFSIGGSSAPSSSVPLQVSGDYLPYYLSTTDTAGGSISPVALTVPAVTEPTSAP